jgi:hypothetical protein
MALLTDAIGVSCGGGEALSTLSLRVVEFQLRVLRKK